jgi:signal transduction histidine kinase/DNA-binding response OmpR family regulator/sugar lactone lactonase YvrE
MRIKLITALLLLASLACKRYEGSFTPSVQDGSMVVSERLSNQKVNGFAQDKDGHIWIATGRGLDKYTGMEYQQFFCTEDSLGLPDNQINAVHASQDGSLWITTFYGVAVHSDKGGFRRIKVLGDNKNMSQILESRSGLLLFIGGNTLYKYDRENDLIRPVVREVNAFGAPPSAVLQPDGRLWVISEGGFRLNCYSTESFAIIESLPIPHQAYHICTFGTDQLWLSGMGSLSILDTRNLAWQPLPAAISAEKRLMSGDIDILYPLNDYSLLLNVIGKGFFHYSSTRGRVTFESDTDFPYDIPQEDIRSLFLDKRGNLWMGTTDHGYHVSYSDKSLFGSNKYLTSALKGKNVTALSTDKDGGLWICTQRDGLFRYDMGTKELREVPIAHLIPDAQVGYTRISRVYSDLDGDLWFVFMEKNRIIRCVWDGKHLTGKDVVFAATPLTVLEDDRGAIWIGGFSPSLVRYDKKDKTTREVSVAQNGGWTFVTDLVLKEPGVLVASCFGTTPVHVNTYSYECRLAPITPEEKAACLKRSIVIPNVLFKDSKNDIWIGTYGNGLLLSENESGHKRPIPGTPCQDICSIQEDRQGNIWVATMAGLGKYDRTVGSFVHYYEADGIGGDQFNDRASCILPDGTLVFGGTHGITWFNPLDLGGKRTVPLVFEYLTVHGHIVAPTKNGPIDKLLSEKPTVTIRHNQNGFGISFAALDYSEYEQIRYAYKLEGFDRDWVKIGTRHDAYFANLPPGKYTLRVRIANGSHSVTETEESLRIHVLPPWHRSWWAILLFSLAGLLLLAMIYTFYRHVRRVRKEAARRIREVRREREKAEEAEKAEKALNKIQMNYFSNVAHEFRTPLTMIAGPAQQLSVSEGVKGQDRQLVDIINRNATWMLSLVNQLLDFNRIGNSKLQMKVAKMDVVKPLRDIAELFRYNASSKGIELATYGLEDPFTMWVDADKVQKVVMNLLSNALKFTPSGGRVTLGFDVIPRGDAAARFPLTEKDTDGQYASISVSDNGPGIAEDDLEKIFERFYQSSTSHKLQGSGIGLYYARALCNLHHGYIKAWNLEGGGAEFCLILPVSASSYPEEERTDQKPQLLISAQQSQPQESTPDEDGAKRHIAVVDDDIDIANYLKILLKPQYKVSLYFDAASALKGMEENSPDLVISDVVMPGMDGYALCEAVKGNIQLSHIPVILVTAKVAVESQVQGLDKGADAYVTKPFQPAYLTALVKSLLENREKLHRQLGSVTTTEDIAPEALSPRDSAFMKELYELMEKELANTDIDITRITEMMKISRTKFYYKVKGLTGENPSVFFKRYKLNRAADLLKEGKFNMSEIAYMTGFNTLSHFSTSFKKQFGVPPSEYGG